MIPTADELIESHLKKQLVPPENFDVYANRHGIGEVMRIFAAYHVKEALKVASNSAQLDWEDGATEDDRVSIDKESIIDSYPVTNIK